MRDDRRCTATTRQGARCRAAAILGGTVCRMHGGASPAVKAAAGRRLTAAAAEQAATALGVPVDTDPHTALLGAVHRAAGVVEYLRRQVNALDATTAVWGRTERTTGGPDGTVTKHAARPNVWLTLYGEWHDKLVRTAKATIDAGVSERLVKVEEAKGEAIARLITDLIDDPALGLDDDQRDRMRSSAAAKLRALPELVL